MHENIKPAIAIVGQEEFDRLVADAMKARPFRRPPGLQRDEYVACCRANWKHILTCEVAGRIVEANYAPPIPADV
jgi:hypothetical protein